MITSPGQTSSSFFTHGPQRDTEVNTCYNTSPAVTLAQPFVGDIHPLDSLPSGAKVNTPLYVEMWNEFSVQHKFLEPHATLLDCLPDDNGVLVCSTTFNDTLPLRHLLVPPIKSFEALRDKHATGFAALSALWMPCVRLLLLFTCWLSTMIVSFGCRVCLSIVKCPDGGSRLLPKLSQKHYSIPRKYAFAPGLPKRYAVLSGLVISCMFASLIDGGLIRPSAPQVRYNRPARARIRGLDPALTLHLRKEYATAKINAAVFGKAPVTSMKSFREEYILRSDIQERARLIGSPRWHARVHDTLPPIKPPLLSREKYELLDTRSWLQGEWESEWDPVSTILSCPRTMCHLLNFAQDLPDDALYGCLETKLG